jgi:hypothetical protein
MARLQTDTRNDYAIQAWHVDSFETLSDLNPPHPPRSISSTESRDAYEH